MLNMTYGEGATINWNTCIGFENGNYIFSNMTENRKRSREDDSSEFMPLSKRINNLHINNNLTSSHPHSHNSNYIHGMNLENGESLSSAVSDENRRPHYDPGINSSQSSYYYQNKLLFELHLERIQRTGQQFPF